MTRMRNWLLALVSVAIWLLAAHVQSGTAPRGADAPPNQFSAARAEAVLARVEGPQRPQARRRMRPFTPACAGSWRHWAFR